MTSLFHRRPSQQAPPDDGAYAQSTRTLASPPRRPRRGRPWLVTVVTLGATALFWFGVPALPRPFAVVEDNRSDAWTSQARTWNPCAANSPRWVLTETLPIRRAP
jgi:hypothetical protein